MEIKSLKISHLIYLILFGHLAIHSRFYQYRLGDRTKKALQCFDAKMTNSLPWLHLHWTVNFFVPEKLDLSTFSHSNEFLTLLCAFVRRC